MMASAVGGDVADPLISQSYLEGDYTKKVNQVIEKSLDQGDAAILTGLDVKIKSAMTGEQYYADTWQEQRLKQGDVLALPTGGSVQLLAGTAKVTFTSGAVVNVTAGKEIITGSLLETNQRYMAAEDTVANCEITSKTAVLQYQGNYGVTFSSKTDYNTMAQALKNINLFKGSFTGYGQGFDLEVAPTRVQALIMFIRVLGEEDAALAYTGGTPFTDVSKGSLSEKYVGYAYEKGYTKGYSATTFRPNQNIPANQYVEFLLRAMGYRDSSSTDLTTTLSVAESVGLLTSNEVAQLQTTQFLRADLVYVSYYALQTPVDTVNQTLSQILQGKGIFTADDFSDAQSLVVENRL